MRVTTDIKNYIRAEVYEKAKPRLDELNEKRDAIVMECMNRYEKFVAKAKAETDTLNKELAATARRLGLTMMNKDHNFIPLNVSTYCFKEIYSSCNVYKYNHDIDEVDEMLRKLKKNIEHKISGIVFKLEAGAKKDEIFAMLAEIHF